MGDVIFDIEQRLKLTKTLTEGNVTDTIIKCRNIQEERVPFSEDNEVSVLCDHRWNMGFRKKLATIIADNFRCKARIIKGNVFMVGSAADSRIAQGVFEYSYSFAMMMANRRYNKFYSMGKETKGVFNEYIDEFLDILVHSLSLE